MEDRETIESGISWTTNIVARLRNAPYGAYAVDLSQTIVFWNLEAERMLGYGASDVLGRKCYEVVQSIAVDGKTITCIENCPAIHAAAQGRIPPVSHVRMRCASGRRERMTVTPLIVDAQTDRTILIHLFHQTNDEDSVAVKREQSLLTARETEILGLLALGLNVSEAARRLVISVHTVRKHIANASKKLGANGMMSSVLEARRRRLI